MLVIMSFNCSLSERCFLSLPPSEQLSGERPMVHQGQYFVSDCVVLHKQVLKKKFKNRTSIYDKPT